MTKRNVLVAIGVVLLAVAGWNAAWRYDDARIGPFGAPKKVRTHLITGKTQALGAHGWYTLDLPSGTSRSVQSPSPSTSPSLAPRYRDLDPGR